MKNVEVAPGRSFRLEHARTYASMLFFVAPLFRPTIVNDWASAAPIKEAFALWLAAACLYAAARFVQRNGRMGLFHVGLFGFLALSAISTLLHDGSLDLMFTNTLMLVSPCLFVSTLQRSEILPFIKSVVLVIGLILLSNLLLVVFIPDGIYSYNGHSRWLLQNGGVQSRWCFLLVLFAGLCDILKRQRLSKLFALSVFLSFVTVWMLGSATSMVSLVVEIVLILFGGRKALRKVDCASLNAVILVLFVAVVLLRVADYLPYEDIALFLGKDLTYSSGSTFTGRTFIWDAVIAGIRESPLIGHGWQRYVATGLTQFFGQQDYSSSHDLWLHVAFVGGFVGLASFVLMYLNSTKGVDSLRSEKLRRLFVAAFAAFLLMSIFEQILASQFMILLAFATSPIVRALDGAICDEGSCKAFEVAIQVEAS